MFLENKLNKLRTSYMPRDHYFFQPTRQHEATIRGGAAIREGLLFEGAFIGGGRVFFQTDARLPIAFRKRIGSAFRQRFWCC